MKVLVMTLKSSTLLILTALTVSSAHAQQVPMSEYGAVPLTLSQPEGLETSLEVQRGDVVWRDSLQPALAARALEESPVRRRPGPLDGAQPGDLLFGVQLSSGIAYCPPIDFDAPTRRVQCYRDFDADGTWDGAYYTRHDSFRSQIVPSRLRGLTAIRKTRFEIADPTQLLSVASEWRFRNWRGGVAQFDYIIEEDRSGDPMPCVTFEGAGANQCIIADLLLEVVPIGNDGARITLLASAPDRRLTIITRGP